MKFPVRLIWDVIGDVYERVFDDDNRRPVDLLWQSFTELGGQVIDYVDLYKKARNIFEVRIHSPWGSFPSTPELVDVTSQVEGLILGVRGNNWVALTTCNETVAPRGYFSLIGSSVEYAPGSSTDLQVTLGDLCRVSTLTSSFTTESWDEVNNPSYVFGPDTTFTADDRWHDGGSSGTLIPQADGLLMRPQWSNWAVIRDNYHYSGDTDWELLWRFKITKWENSTYTRALAIDSFGDAGPNYEIRLEDTGTNIEVSCGMFAKSKYINMEFAGSTITRGSGSFRTEGFRAGMTMDVLGSTSNDGAYTIVSVTPFVITVVATFTTESAAGASLTTSLDLAAGSTIGWRNKLIATDTDAPIYVEFLTRYNAATAELYSEVWLDGEVVTQAVPYSVPPGRRRVAVDFFNQHLDAQAVLEFVGATSGSLWESTAVLDLSTDIGEAFAYIYQTPEPLTDSSRIQLGPYDLVPPVEVLSQDETTVVLDINEDYKEYAPEYARIEKDGEYLIAELASQVDAVATYTIVRASTPGLVFIGDVDLHPWYITQAEFTWIDTHLFSVQHLLPFENQEVFFLEAQADELDLYNRYGTLLQMPQRGDSQPYLDALRGMQFGLESPHTIDHTSRGVGILVGLPYTLETGFIESIERVTDDLGGALYDNIIVNGRTIRADPFWDDSGLILPVGTYLEKLTPVATSVNVYDYKNNLALVQAVTNVWKTWGTFVVQIPADIGISQTSGTDLIRYLDRAKGKHTDYVVEYFHELSEDQFNDTFYDIEVPVQESIAHTLEDGVFDDKGEVIANALNFQTISSEDYGEEYQLPDNLALDAIHLLDFDEALDATELAKFDVKKIHNGITMGGDTWPDRPDFEYDYRNQGIDMKRDITAAETSASLQKNSLRVSDPNDGQDYFYRPYSLHWLFTGASPQWSVRDGGGTLYTLHTQVYEDVSPVTVGENLNATYIQNSNFMYVCGDNGEIWESVDYGENWTDKSVGGTDDFLACDRDWIVGNNKVAYQRVATVWTSKTITASAVVFTGLSFPSALVGYAAANNGANCEVYKTTDGGATWGVAVAIDTAVQVADIHFFDDDNGWAATDAGLYKTDDAGATWVAYEAAQNFASVAMATVDIVVGGLTAGGTVYRSVNGTAVTPTFASQSVGATSINGIHFMDDIKGDLVNTAGSAYNTIDGGATWSAVTAGAGEVWSGIHTVYPFYKIIVGSTAGTDEIMRWK